LSASKERPEEARPEGEEAAEEAGAAETGVDEAAEVAEHAATADAGRAGEPEEQQSARPAGEAAAEKEEASGQPPAAGDVSSADAAEAEPAADAGGEQPTAEEQPADQAPRPAARKEMKSGDKAKDVVPGANLEPIAITEERELTAEERARLEAEEEERARREASASAADDDELPRRAAVKVPKDTTIQATGKRKSSVARVLLRAGGGKIEVNGRELDEYFPRLQHQSMARQPLITAGYDGEVDLRIRVHGGGITGQAGAVRHGIARALTELDPELRRDLKRRGLLTRDAREKERRKAGLKKARKRPQFSKR
jgi:small subunit ribosomal protein S9